MSVEKDLIDYVIKHEIPPESYQRIKEFCKGQTPHSLILYRGHSSSRVIRDSPWYSASKKLEVARNQFASKDCCVFKIHLVEVPIIDINKIIGDKIGDRTEEEECIFLGGGIFYKDESLTEKGFTDNGKGNFECWYKIESKSQFNLQRILNTIPEDEYELISGPINIIGFNITDREKQLVFNKIAKIKQKGGTSRMNSEKEGDTIFEDAVIYMKTAKTERELQATIWKFSAASKKYEEAELYIKAANCYNNIIELLEKIILMADESRSLGYYEALGGMYNLLGITYEKSKMYKKAALAHQKSENTFEIYIEKSINKSSKYEKAAQSFRNLANNAENKGALREMKKEIGKAMKASTAAFEKQKGMSDMWHPTAHGRGATPKSKSRSKSKRKNRKTRRA